MAKISEGWEKFKGREERSCENLQNQVSFLSNSVGKRRDENENKKQMSKPLENVTGSQHWRIKKISELGRV